MRYLLIGLLALPLVGCQSPKLITQKAYVPKISKTFFEKCKVVDKYPEIAKLTDRQVGKLLDTLDYNNRTCAAANAAVYKFLLDAAMIAEQ
jgi:hypothetical protein